MTDGVRGVVHRSLLGSAPAAVVAIAVLCAAGPADAQFRGFEDRGYVGPAYFEIPGVKGGWKAPKKSLIRTEAHQWKASRPTGMGGRGGQGARADQGQGGQAVQAGQGSQSARAAQADRGAGASQGQGQGQAGSRRRGGIFGQQAAFNAPGAPAKGEGTIIVTIDKQNPVLSTLMQRCHNKTAITEAIYTVSSDLSSRQPGPRPAMVPDYFDFKLKNLQFTDCPVADGAPEQAFVVKFSDIEWLNWQPQTQIPIELHPAVLRPLAKLTGTTKSWVVTWIAPAHDVSDDQCPVMHERPSEADYYALMSPEEAAKEKIALAGQGGPNYQNGQMGLRGPNRLNVTYLPGIVRDPGLPEPQTKVARGLNLDGDDGTKRKHKNYVSEDGKLTGIDNQLYTVEGCIAGWQGHKGFIMQFSNNQMRDGSMSILLEVSGIDDEKNDNEVYVTLYYSLDPMAKSGSGAQILRDYTFNVSNDVEFTHYQARLQGRIVDGVIETERVKSFRAKFGGSVGGRDLADAGMRLEILPDGNLKGVLGGYVDWREISSTYVSSIGEFYHGFQQPALYNSLKRNADGMKDPVTGEYRGISTAYDIEGVPAFIISAPRNIASADNAQKDTATQSAQ